MSQSSDIFNHLYSHGSITPIEALNKYGCFRLGARIYDLRGEGHDIKTLTVAGKKNRYAKYVLDKKNSVGGGQEKEPIYSLQKRRNKYSSSCC